MTYGHLQLGIEGRSFQGGSFKPHKTVWSTNGKSDQ